MKKLKLDWGVWHAPFHQSWSEVWRQQCQLIGTNLASFPGHWPLTGRLIPVKPGKCRQEAHTGIRTMRQCFSQGSSAGSCFVAIVPSVTSAHILGCWKLRGKLHELSEWRSEILPCAMVLDSLTSKEVPGPQCQRCSICKALVQVYAAAARSQKCFLLPCYLPHTCKASLG